MSTNEVHMVFGYYFNDDFNGKVLLGIYDSEEEAIKRQHSFFNGGVIGPGIGDRTIEGMLERRYGDQVVKKHYITYRRKYVRGDQVVEFNM